MGNPEFKTQPAFPHDLFVRAKALWWRSDKDSELGYAHAFIHALALFCMVVIFFGAWELAEFSSEAVLSWSANRWVLENVHVVSLLSITGQRKVVFFLWCFVGIWGLMRYKSRRKPVYLVDFSCFLPDSDLKSNYEASEYITRRTQVFTIPSMEFQRKIFLRSGLGEETYIPPFCFGDRITPVYEDAWKEAELVLFGCVDCLLNKTGVRPQDISVLVSNCSLFAPMPSHSSLLVNRYKMREDVKTIELSGMGCSASVIACKLAKDILETRPNQYALVVSYESITLNWYFGNRKSMLVTNCLFRMGGAAMLLTNKQSERSRSKYEFSHCIRTHKGADDKAYGCAFQCEDEAGAIAVALNKNLMGVAADALRTNMVTLGPLILPSSELFFYVFSFLCVKLLKLKVHLYQPNFKLAAEHFCFHAGGPAVIEAIQKSLHFEDSILEPSRATLHRFGNTSASCLWYVLSYMEAKQRIKKGDRVWMLGLGSGFKCNSAILKVINDINFDGRNPWAECIHRYPCLINQRL